MDPRELVEQALRCEEQGRLDDAVAAWLAVARLIPTYPQAYQRLFTIHVHRREVDPAFSAASVLASLDALEGVARELYEDYVPRRLPPRAGRSLDLEDWALLRHPLEDPAVGDRLAAALPKLRLKPATDDAIDVATLEWAASLLGANAGDLPRDGAPPLVARADLEELWRNYALRERLFFAGRAATALRFPVHLLVKATAPRIAEAVGASSTDEIERWQVGVELTRARAGMLVCGEYAVARELLQREDAGDLALGHLALFAVSPAHHRLRAKLGIAIGVASDAPTEAPAPPPMPPTSSPIERGIAALAQACMAARDLPSVLRATASVPPESGIVHRAGWSSATSAVFALTPPTDALVLARILGWEHPVGAGSGARLEHWHVLLLTGAAPHGAIAVLPSWGPWVVYASLGRRPNGAPLVPGGAAGGPFALAPGDVVYAIRVELRG